MCPAQAVQEEEEGRRRGGGGGACQGDARCTWGALDRLPQGHRASRPLEAVGRKAEGSPTAGAGDPGCGTEGRAVQRSGEGRGEGARPPCLGPRDSRSEGRTG